jgi:hypothetical protein
MITFAIGLHKDDCNKPIIFYDFDRHKYVWISDINNVPAVSDWFNDYGDYPTFADWEIRPNKRKNVHTIATYSSYEEYLQSDKTHLYDLKKSYPEYFV